MKEFFLKNKFKEDYKHKYNHFFKTVHNCFLIFFFNLNHFSQNSAIIHHFLL